MSNTGKSSGKSSSTSTGAHKKRAPQNKRKKTARLERVARPAPAVESPSARRKRTALKARVDGFVDRREFHSRMVEIFYLADTDKDGYLTRVELVVIEETPSL